MKTMGQKICLNMIVKNEAPVIRRCLDSVRPIIDYWVIVDTGSTDRTQEIIREHLSDLPGELHERPWRDFAHNRSEALELARGKGDYTLIIDADDTLEISPDTALPALSADSYTIEIRDVTIVYSRTQLVRSALPWHYEGVLHEYITCDGAGPCGYLSGIRMRRNHDGARRKDPETYRRDAAILEAALKTETNKFLLSRYRFYLAQSYRDCRELEKALENYLIRSELGFWQEEVFISLYAAAQLKQELGGPTKRLSTHTFALRRRRRNGLRRCMERPVSAGSRDVTRKATRLQRAPSPSRSPVTPCFWRLGYTNTGYSTNTRSTRTGLGITGSPWMPACVF